MFKGDDLGQFIKTKLAQQMQKSQIGNFVKQKGAPPIIANVKNAKLGEKSKTADGIDLGQQVDAGVIPIIYGHVGMSNTQFDLGQKPSDVDAEFVTQEVKFPVSEGSIFGLAYRATDASGATRDPSGLNENFIGGFAGEHGTEHFKQIVINDSFVVDPITSVANFKDIKIEMTKGDGGGVYQSATISDYNPLLQEEDGDKIEAVNDPTDGKLLNDLGDVTAAKGVNNVLYWNTATSRWEAKSFNALLNEAGATYDGGAGGSGGSGGDGGSGGLGGTGGGATSATAKTYTQFNPPATHIETTGTLKTTTTVIEPTGVGAAVVSGKGAPLRRLDQATPYFTTDIDFADVDETVDTIDLTTFFPEGIYKEITTVSTVVDGTITLCGTERPITGSGDLNCLTPNVELAPDGQTSTTKTRVNGSVTVYYVLTTTLCGREFILDQSSYTISHLKNGGYKHTKSLAPMSMNAGSGSKEDGTQQIGSISGANDCNATALDDFNFQDYSLSDYLTTYPDQILKAANTVKVYAWFDNRAADDEYTISTNTYLHAVEVVKPLDDFDGLYKQGALTQSAYQLFEPDHGFKAFIADTDSDDFDLDDKRRYTDAITGSFSDTSPPEPLVVQDGLESTGSSGTAGNGGAAGAIGSGGSAGTQGSVTVPSVPDIPTVEMSKDSSYSGDGVADTVTLPSVAVTNADALAENTLTIRVPQGTVDVVTVGGSVTAIGQNSSIMTLIGTASNLQGTLDSGLKFFSTTATTGDVTITFHISSSEGASESTRQIRSEAVTEYVAPKFTITVTGTSDDFQCFVRDKKIMEAITPTGTTSEIAQQIKSAINSYSSTPNWTATKSGNVVTCTAPVGIGASYNGDQPDDKANIANQPCSISTIFGGVSPSRVTQPKQSTKQLKGKFIPALAFTNTLDRTDVSFFQVKYRPEQGDGEATLSEIGLYVGGRDQMEEPNQSGDNSLTFEQWKNANYTSTKGYSANTAWVFFDYLTSPTFGLGNDIVLNATQKEQLYKDIYNAADWCAIAPTGDISEAQASLFHGIIYGAESKFEALQKIADRMFAKFVYLNGNPRLIFDANSYSWTRGSYTHVPVIKKLVNQTNSAETTYQGGSIDNIFNVVNVKFNNPANYFRLEEVQYRNPTSIAKYGERETTIELIGCTSKQAAMYHGAWYYETEASNSETVSYIAGWDHYDVLPNDLIYLNDTLRVDTDTIGGRVVSDNGDGTVTLDRDAGTGSIAITDSLGFTITGTVNGTTATISTSNSETVNLVGGEQLTFNADFSNDAVWNKYNGTLYGNYRVIAIEESEDGIYAVTAQKHDPDKYTRIWANTV